MKLGLSGNVLPIHPQPKTDEIFSSWYCRIAQENGIKLHTLEVQLFGRDKQIWTRDIDRSIDEPTLERVASICATDIDRARDTTLRSFETLLFDQITTTSNTNWILPAGVFHRKRRRRSMQFCPLCLAMDQVPYYRKQWRLALHTFCDQHDVLLHDCCPKCQAPVVFHRQELGDRWRHHVHSITLCTTCGFDLKRSPAFQAPAIEIHSWINLKSQLFFLDNGWTFIPGQNFPYSHLYFSALRNLIYKLLSNWTTSRLLEHFQEKFPVTRSLKIVNRQAFEFYGVTDRHCLLQIGTWFLLDWPNRLLELCTLLKVRHSELIRDFDQIPFWFFDAVQELKYLPVGPSEGEKAAMLQLLIKYENTPYKTELWKIIAKRISTGSVRQTLENTGIM
ncbi:TniQ family protein [Undibacterium amnicola]|uniref:TniQ family protein n=1 Tax=Undibacterium amnicola TaxID=1834038 RepID=A0ABR6XSM2_9BURK|nr:TniQ family protein [Undibacterium amnicola]MBC3832431.1 TniQ family protein [Undibacterium amnicola]